MPQTWVERLQIVEYARAFFLGRAGWTHVGALLIISGAFGLFRRGSVVEVGGLWTGTLGEDMELVMRLHKEYLKAGRPHRIAFTPDPICWTEVPKDLGMLARQRRRWHLGLMQTVMKHDQMIGNPRFGLTGMLSMPFHAYIEAIGCVVEVAGTILLPIFLLMGAIPKSLFLLFVVLAIGYGTALSLASVLLAEVTVRRYPRFRDAMVLMAFAFIENFGYRQIMTFFRAQGVLRYFWGQHHWEVVVHSGLPAKAEAAQVV